MSIIAAGTNYKYCPLPVREKLYFFRSKLAGYLNDLVSYPSIRAGFILSTCNRVEIYASVNDINKGFTSLRGFLAFSHGLREESVNPFLYTFKGRNAIQHLSRVAAGLDSQIIGESQIVEQVIFAFNEANKQGAIDGLLEQAFEEALALAQDIRRETGILHQEFSLADLVLEAIRKNYPNFRNKKVLILGVGKVSELVTKHLKEMGLDSVFIANKTFDKAKLLAESINAKVVRFDALKKELRNADIVISATGSPHLILKKEDILDVINTQHRRDDSNLLIIDLGIPRNVDPEIKNIKGVKLLNLDELGILISQPLKNFFKVGSRNSLLALKQVEEVTRLLNQFYPDLKFEVIGMDTYGDKDKTTPISDIEGTDFFTREIEGALLEKKIDFAVHSAKDLPDKLPQGLMIAAITRQIDPCDALVSRESLELDKLRYGAKIGTSSQRRKDQLKNYRNDFQFIDIRGNIGERLAKLDNDGLDAIVLAACALVRLGLQHRISQYLPFEILKPHPLQGALAIETRAEDIQLINLLGVIHGK
ncbi:MAG: glutamyl-tRNA reductase [Actinobacteria bacterium]|nr:glutamyl-tRNA reductase [Actinomycetota bacterium]